MINPADVGVANDALEAARVNSSAKIFLLNRARSIYKVRIDSTDGTEFCEIPIYLKLTKREIKENKAFLNNLGKSSIVTDQEAAVFLSTITVDPELDMDFWLSEDLDTSIAEKIITTYIQEVIKQYDVIRKFRKDP